MWGLIISVVLTLVAVVVAMMVNKERKPSLLSWGVAVVGFVLMWIVGARLASSIESRSQIKNQIYSLTTLADGALDEIGLREISSTYGLTSVAAELVGDGALSYYEKRIWAFSIVLLVLTVIVGVGFGLLMERNVRRGARVAMHGRAPRNSHRGRRR